MDFGVKGQDSVLDSTASQVVAQFGEGQGYSEPFWFVSKINKKFGPEASTATVEIRTSAWGGDAPLIAGVKNSPLSNCRGYQKAKAVVNDTVVFVGYVVMPDENFDLDAATVECADARWLLEGGNIVGSFWRSDDGKSVSYMQSIPAIFNEGGLPNRIKGQNGLTYCFCTANFGIVDGYGPAESKGNSPDTASHWDPESIWTYFCETLDHSIVKDLTSAYKWYWTLPSDIIIPKGAASSLTTFAAGGSTPPVGRSKSPEICFHATPVNVALQRVCEMAGAYSLGVTYDSGGTTTITIVPTKCAGGYGTSLKRAQGKADEAFAKDGVVVGGGIKRDFRQHYTQVVESGDNVYVETRIASTDKATIADQQAAGVQLLTSWDSKIVDKFIVDFNEAYGKAKIPAKQELAKLLQQYPDLFESWVINPKINFATGTSEAQFPFAKISNRPILPHLLTTYSGLAPNGIPTGLTGGIDIVRTTQPMSIWIEVGDDVDIPHDTGTAQKPASSDNGKTPPDSGDDYPPDVPGTSDSDFPDPGDYAPQTPTYEPPGGKVDPTDYDPGSDE